MKEKKRVLSLFSGCGGMDIGFEGGFKCLKKSTDAFDVQPARQHVKRIKVP